LFSPEYQTFLQFQSANLLLKEAVYGIELEADDDPNSYQRDRALIQLTDTVLDAISYFGLRELFARRAERYEAEIDQRGREEDNPLYDELKNYIPVQAQRTERVGRRATRLLEHARDALATLQATEQTFQQSLDQRARRQLREQLIIFSEEVRDVLLDVDLKGSDFTQITTILNDVTQVDDGMSLVERLEQELSRLRDFTENRELAVAGNLPVWKLTSIGLMACIGSFAIYKCKVHGKGCASAEKAASAVGINIGMLGVVFC
jgi:hypothetical protein